jgi:type I restriction enzyme R subunit
MRTNLILLADPQFEPFAEAVLGRKGAAHLARPVRHACRTALEFAVKWVYSVDGSLQKPYEDKLVTLISTEDFKDLIPPYECKIKLPAQGGQQRHPQPQGVSRDQACWLCKTCTALWISLPTLRSNYIETGFDKALLEAKPDPQLL